LLYGVEHHEIAIRGHGVEARTIRPALGGAKRRSAAKPSNLSALKRVMLVAASLGLSHQIRLPSSPLFSMFERWNSAVNMSVRRVRDDSAHDVQATVDVNHIARDQSGAVASEGRRRDTDIVDRDALMHGSPRGGVLKQLVEVPDT
jgi:hypothetical protein